MGCPTQNCPGSGRPPLWSSRSTPARFPSDVRKAVIQPMHSGRHARHQRGTQPTSAAEARLDRQLDYDHVMESLPSMLQTAARLRFLSPPLGHQTPGAGSLRYVSDTLVMSWLRFTASKVSFIPFCALLRIPGSSAPRVSCCGLPTNYCGQRMRRLRCHH
jgi:hypothetical protein